MSLVLSDISYAIGGAHILSGVSARLEPGRIATIVGPNGSGKTTLANIISGLTRPRRGEVTLGNRRLTGLRPDEVARAGVSRMLQTQHLAWNATAAENVSGTLDRKRADRRWRLPMPWGRAEAEQHGRALEWLARVGIQEQADTPARDLSFGQQRLLALARALALPGQLLLLDEPLTGIKGASLDRVIALLGEHARAGRMILVIDHTISAVEQLEGEAWFLFDQRLRVFESFASLRESDEFAAVYVGGAGRVSVPVPERPRSLLGRAASPALALRNVWGGYTPRSPVIKGASLDAHPGEVVCLLGRNGSGKSTLLGLIAGLLTPTSGAIELQGHALLGLRPDQRTERGLWLLPQDHRVLRSLSIRENVTMGSLPLDRRSLATIGLTFGLGERGRLYAQRADAEIREQVKASPSRRAGTLSGGEQARVALAILGARPKSVLLLDEPTSGVDGISKSHLKGKIDSWKRDDCCIVIVEHDYDFVLDVADRILLIDDGRLSELMIWRSMTPRDIMQAVLCSGSGRGPEGTAD